MAKNCEDWATLPTEVLENIFATLPIADVLTAARVCRRFRDVVGRASYLRYKKRYFKYRYREGSDVDQEWSKEAQQVAEPTTSAFKQLCRSVVAD
jgi:hypothetical protein